MSDAMDEYRLHLVEAQQKSLEAFDKTILSLSGGALAISLVFVHDIIGDGEIRGSCLLFIAWVCWIVSMVSTLSSFLLSHHALRKAIDQVDAGVIHTNYPGGRFNYATHVANVLSFIAFVIGVILIVIFVSWNLE